MEEEKNEAPASTEESQAPSEETPSEEGEAEEVSE